jgi:hypothetical protein
LFYSLQRGQGIFIAINYTHVFSGDPKEVMELLGVKDKYLKKLRDNGYLGFSREGDKYWYTQKDVDCFLHSFHYEPFNSNINKLWTL